MSRPFLLALSLAALAALPALLAGACARSEAQESSSTLWVSGMRVGGGSRAVVRLRNVAPASSGRFFVHYTVRGTSSGVPLSLPAAGATGVSLLAGRTLELDLGEIVNLYRKSQGYGSFAGPVQFVAYGEGGTDADFGPDTIVVDAAQTEGAARFQAAVEWR